MTPDMGNDLTVLAVLALAAWSLLFIVRRWVKS
jgi:hypothetical protein